MTSMGLFLFVSCWCPPIWDCLTLENYQTCEVYMCYTLEISVKPPCLWASFHPLTPLLVISAKEGNFIKSQYEMLKLGTKCWISAFNVRGSRGIIVGVQVGAVKIYVAAVEALRKIERQGETQETITWWFPGFSLLMLTYCFCRFFWISPCVWPNSGYWCCLFLTLRISLL